MQKLLALAEKADQLDVPDGVSLPEEIKRRGDRVAVTVMAKRKIAARAEERYQCEKTEYDENPMLYVSRQSNLYSTSSNR